MGRLEVVSVARTRVVAETAKADWWYSRRIPICPPVSQLFPLLDFRE